MKRLTSFTSVGVVLALFAFGIANTISLKVVLTTAGTSAEGRAQVFTKPLFCTLAMFVALSLALPIDRHMRPWRRATHEAGHDASGKAEGARSPSAADRAKTWCGKVCTVAIPGVCDLMQTALSSTGLLFVTASVHQVLQGAQVVFAAVLTACCLKRRLRASHWLGVVLCTLGLSLVGCGAVLDSEAAGSSADESHQVMVGVLLCLAAQLFAGAQVVFEEHLLQNADLPALQVVGFEGVWAALVMLAVVLPLAHCIPGNDRGRVEDTLDSLAMLRNSQPGLIASLLVKCISCLSFNVARIVAVGMFSGVSYVMLNACMTSLIWAIGLLVHYRVEPSSPIAEAWTDSSWVEAVGFATIILGQLVYGGFVRVPGLPVEEPAEADQERAPGAACCAEPPCSRCSTRAPSSGATSASPSSAATPTRADELDPARDSPSRGVQQAQTDPNTACKTAPPVEGEP